MKRKHNLNRNSPKKQVAIDGIMYLLATCPLAVKAFTDIVTQEKIRGSGPRVWSNNSPHNPNRLPKNKTIENGPAISDEAVSAQLNQVSSITAASP